MNDIVGRYQDEHQNLARELAEREIVAKERGLGILKVSERRYCVVKMTLVAHRGSLSIPQYHTLCKPCTYEKARDFFKTLLPDTTQPCTTCGICGNAKVEGVGDLYCQYCPPDASAPPIILPVPEDARSPSVAALAGLLITQFHNGENNE
jgi:hypothetical protein